MWEGALGVAAYVLVASGLAVIALGVVGIVRLPDVYSKLHAASKAASLGLVLVLAGSVGTGDPGTIGRAALIATFLLVTSPVSAHAIALAARVRGEPLGTPDAVDESVEDA